MEGKSSSSSIQRSERECSRSHGRVRIEKFVLGFSILFHYKARLLVASNRHFSRSYCTVKHEPNEEEGRQIIEEGSGVDPMVFRW